MAEKTKNRNTGSSGIGFVATCIALVACLLLTSACEDKRLERAIDAADMLAFEGKYEAAQSALDEVLAVLAQTNGESALELEALSKAGRISHLFLRRPERALRYYRRIVELSPGSSEAFEAREHMARIHLEAEDQNAAVTQLQALVAGFSEREGIDRFQYELARAYFVMGDAEQARTESRYLLQRWPESDYADRVRMLVATAYHVQGRLEEAVEAYDLVMASARDFELVPRAQLEKAGCLASLGRKEEALAGYREALKTHPDPMLVRMRLERLESRMAVRDLDNLGPAW